MHDDNVLTEVERVAIGKEDVENIRNFFLNFEIPMSEELTKSLEEFEKNETIENQNRVRLAICAIAYNSDHPAFTDQLFSPIIKSMEDVLYRNHFDKDLEEVLKKKEE